MPEFRRIPRRPGIIAARRRQLQNQARKAAKPATAISPNRAPKSVHRNLDAPDTYQPLRFCWRDAMFFLRIECLPIHGHRPVDAARHPSRASECNRRTLTADFVRAPDRKLTALKAIGMPNWAGASQGTTLQAFAMKMHRT